MPVTTGAELARDSGHSPGGRVESFTQKRETGIVERDNSTH